MRKGWRGAGSGSRNWSECGGLPLAKWRALGIGDAGDDFPQPELMGGPRAVGFRQIRGEAEFSVALQALEERAKDGEGHVAEAGFVAVAVDALIEIGLGEAREFSGGGDIDEMGDFHAVAAGEGEGFQEAAAGGVFAGERLEDAGELGVKERKQGADEDFRDAAAAVRLRFRAESEWALVKGFHVVQLWVREQRAYQAGDEAGVEIRDISINITNNVSGGDVEGFPEVFAFSGAAREVRGDVGSSENSRSGLQGQLAGGIGGIRIDHQQLIHEWGARHQRATDDFHDAADGGCFVQRRDTNGDAVAARGFPSEETRDIREIPVVETLGGAHGFRAFPG